jgi:hypothetical protein
MFNLSELSKIPANVHTRWASPENFGAAKGVACKNDDGRKRSSNFPMKVDEKKVLAEMKGVSGTVRRIWITINDRSPEMLRGMKIEMFWDGAKEPAVSAPIGDFFCHGIGRMATFESALFSSPEGRSFNCIIPMPFRNSMKIVVTNGSKKDLDMFFYDINMTIGDVHDESTAYFHAIWRRENPTKFMKDYEILPKIKGSGRFLGCNIGVIADTEKWFTSWWGEGEVKMFIDGDGKYPTLCGTGAEDYIGTGWGLAQYSNLYQGATIADKDKFQFCFYRLHIPDPVYFHNDIRITIHQIGWAGHDKILQFHGIGRKLFLGKNKANMQKEVNDKASMLFERTDDWSSCAYFYLNSPENGMSVT